MVADISGPISYSLPHSLANPYAKLVTTMMKTGWGPIYLAQVWAAFQVRLIGFPLGKLNMFIVKAGFAFASVMTMELLSNTGLGEGENKFSC